MSTVSLWRGKRCESERGSRDKLAIGKNLKRLVVSRDYKNHTVFSGIGSLED
jgi:hypothetical protein